MIKVIIKPFTRRFVSTQNLYQINKNRLSLLPKITFLVVVSLLVYSVVSFFGIDTWLINLSTGNPQPNVVRESMTASQKMHLDESIKIEQTSSKVLGTIEQKNNLSFVSSNGYYCSLINSDQKPSNLSYEYPVIVDSWWLPSSCQIDIYAIQVWQGSWKSQQSNLVLVKPEDQIWITVFGPDSLEINLSEQIEALIQPIYGKISANNTGSASDMYTYQETTYYLEGSCDNPSSQCKLWQIDQKTSTKRLINSELAKLIQDGRKIRFAATQESLPEAISLISYQVNSPDLDLVRISLSSNLIIQKLPINKNQQANAYQKYYR